MLGTPRSRATHHSDDGAVYRDARANTKVEEGRQVSQAERLTIELNSIARGRCDRRGTLWELKGVTQRESREPREDA